VDVPQCALEGDAREQQLSRYRRLAGSVTALERTNSAMTVRFEDSVGRELLDHTLRVERSCCPFFAIAFDERGRRLTIGVAEPDQVPALDALAWALSQHS
jgi:hypothetical protein